MYRILVKKSAQKELGKIPSPFNKRIVSAIDALAETPRPFGVKKLEGEEAYRIRIGDYRVVYTIEDIIKVVEIQRIGNRKDIYKQ